MKTHMIRVAALLALITAPSLAKAEATAATESSSTSSKVQEAVARARARGTSIGKEMSQPEQDQAQAETQGMPTCCAYLPYAEAVQCAQMAPRDAIARFCGPIQENQIISRLLEQQREIERKALYEAQAQQGLVNPTSSNAQVVGTRTVYTWTPDLQYEVHIQPQRMTVLEFEPGEFVLQAELPPETGFKFTNNEYEVAPSEGEVPKTRTYAAIKATMSGMDTDAYILSNRRSYSLRLRSDTEVHMPRISWVERKKITVAAPTQKKASAPAKKANSKEKEPLYYLAPLPETSHPQILASGMHLGKGSFTLAVDPRRIEQRDIPSVYLTSGDAWDERGIQSVKTLLPAKRDGNRLLVKIEDRLEDAVLVLLCPRTVHYAAFRIKSL